MGKEYTLEAEQNINNIRDLHFHLSEEYSKGGILHELTDAEIDRAVEKMLKDLQSQGFEWGNWLPVYDYDEYEYLK